ncbi:cytochrome P450 [Streptomyces sp. NBC_00094]|uniref:cytochrome P450 n=1 Tax=Streptomyces sp. NBC_00094 TaxID=2903620 RepID=UPI00225BACCD|nr:cytochrome P450 [Streptomyces sp. NBC_00094]MCX5389228.1 cytochrome P450 [Streptomyces sp. NBC_00094]
MSGRTAGARAGAGSPEPFDPARLDLADPYPVYRRYRETDPVHAVRNPDGGAGPTTWYLFGHVEVTQVLTGRSFGRASPLTARTTPVPDGYVTLRRVVENWLVFLDPPRHTRLRARVTPPLGAAAVAALRPRVREIAEELVAPLARRPVVEFVEGFAAPYPLLVIGGLLGVEAERWPWFRAQALALQQAGGTRGDRTPDALAGAERAAEELDGYFHRELAARRTEDRGDLLSALARAGAEDPSLSGTELAATCTHLLTAGHETTTGLLGKAVLALIARPEVRGELRDDPGLLPGAVDEFLRFDPPVQMVTRWAHRDTELAGRTVRRGDRLQLVLGSAHRDPARFPDPDVLDIHRDGGRHCAFGLGVHYCAGAALARAEAEIGLGVLLDRLPALGPGARPGVEVEYAPDWVFHGPSRLTLS